MKIGQNIPEYRASELYKILEAAMQDISHCAQIDYLAVNSPNGIRYGQSANEFQHILAHKVDSLLVKLSTDEQLKEWGIKREYYIK